MKNEKMRSYRNPMPFIKLVIKTGLIVAIGYVSLLKIDEFLALQSRSMKNQAIDGCAQASRYTYTKTEDRATSIIEEPNEASYQECLRFKGVK